MQRTLAAILIVLACGGVARAQSTVRIFDIQPGLPVADLPVGEFVDPACGTNGGPPSLPLSGFDQFAMCAAEPDTGLHEVWFIYDDEWEYIARAQRDELVIRRYSANSFFGQPIITSLLIGGDGIVQGYRVVTDPRAPPEVRIEGHLLAAYFKGMFNDTEWICIDLPQDAREQPIDRLFIKQACEMRTEDLVARIEVHHLYKPGQDLRLNPRMLDEAVGDFESWTRLEVFAAAAVRDAPCCRASLRP